MTEKTCKWTWFETPMDFGFWETECGGAFEEDGYNFCPKCRREIEELDKPVTEATDERD
jgi:hypothetical protein